MSAPTKRQKLTLTVLGVLYLAFAIFAFVNVYTFWHLSGSAPYSFLMYALLYAAIAALFFTYQRWLLAFFAVNFLANVGLFIFRTYAAHGTSVLPVIIVALNALLVWYLYAIRRSLADSTQGRAVAVATFVFWGATIYTVINNL